MAKRYLETLAIEVARYEAWPDQRGVDGHCQWSLIIFDKLSTLVTLTKMMIAQDGGGPGRRLTY